MIYINRHPNYDYAVAVIGTFHPELKDIVASNGFLSWMPMVHNQVMVSREGKGDENLRRFMDLVVDLDEIKVRDGRTDEWEDCH